MQVVLSTISKFHTFDLARQLMRHNVLKRVFSGYPWWKLRDETVPRDMVDTYPWFVVPRMALARYGLLHGPRMAALDEFSQTMFAAHVARNLPDADIFHALSRYALRPGLAAKARGQRFILDVGSSHISNQVRLMAAEAEALGIAVEMPHPRGVDRELEEYEAADLITLPSQYAIDSFVAEGVPRAKLAKITYGVDLTRFAPVSVADDGVFRVIYVGALSMRKGIHYLLQAFAQAAIPGSELVLIGSHTGETATLLKDSAHLNLVVTGHLPQSELARWLSRATVFAFPSLDDGYGLVQLQAMACGCPVIATTNSGGRDCITSGRNGFIVPAADAGALAEKLVWFADHPDEARAMREVAIAEAAQASNVTRYGDDMMAAYRSQLTPQPSPAELS
jgi:alpha-maltose-1-phosphate synthase